MIMITLLKMMTLDDVANKYYDDYDTHDHNDYGVDNDNDLGLLWQIIRIGLFNQISLEQCPGLANLLQVKKNILLLRDFCSTLFLSLSFSFFLHSSISFFSLSI